MQNLLQDEKLLAYHDRSDGGLLATLCEMAFAGHCGVQVGGQEGEARRAVARMSAAGPRGHE